MSRELAELVYRVVEAERRIRNMVRYAEVTEVDAAKGLVKVADRGGGQGHDLPSPWLPWAEVGAPRDGGNSTTWRPPTPGQRVMWVSPSGNLAEGIIMPAAFSNSAGQPSDKGDEHVETIGQARVTMRGDSITLELGGNSKIVMSAGRIECTADTIVMNGVVHLGAEGGKLLHRKGDVDSSGDLAVGSATKVFAV